MFAWVAIDFRVLVYRERYDDSNIMGELFLRPDCTFEQVRQIIAEVSAAPRLESSIPRPLFPRWLPDHARCIVATSYRDLYGMLRCIRTWVKTGRSNWFMVTWVTR